MWLHTYKVKLESVCISDTWREHRENMQQTHRHMMFIYSFIFWLFEIFALAKVVWKLMWLFTRQSLLAVLSTGFCKAGKKWLPETNRGPNQLLLSLCQHQQLGTPPEHWPAACTTILKAQGSVKKINKWKNTRAG